MRTVEIKFKIELLGKIFIVLNTRNYYYFITKVEYHGNNSNWFLKPKSMISV